MKWFKHMSRAGDDPALQRIRAEFGMAGIGRYWTIMEEVAKAMEVNGSPECAKTVNQWCALLECKKKQLVLFLKANENEMKSKSEQNGLLLIITVPKLLNLKDDYNKKSGHLYKDIDIDKDISSLRSDISRDNRPIKKNRSELKKVDAISAPPPKPATQKNQKLPLPDWLDQQTWDDFRAMRKASKHPMTDKAEALMIEKLERFRALGHDPTALLEQSIINGWRDVYELKQERKNEIVSSNSRASGGYARKPSDYEIARSGTERLRAEIAAGIL